MGTSQAPQQPTPAAAAEPRSGGPAVVPTPTAHENDQFRIAQANGTLHGRCLCRRGASPWTAAPSIRAASIRRRRQRVFHDRAKPDPIARRSGRARPLLSAARFVRAATALVLGNRPGAPHPEQVVKAWGDDAMAGRILKAAMSPTSTADYPQLQTTAVLPMLAPASCLCQVTRRRLLARSGRSGDDPAAVYRRYGTPCRAVYRGRWLPDLLLICALSATTLGPARKLLIRTRAYS